MNKDASANSPVVTPVPPPANELNSNNHPGIKGEEEPMEINADSKQTNDVNSRGAAVKTEVLETSRGNVMVNGVSSLTSQKLKFVKILDLIRYLERV